MRLVLIRHGESIYTGMRIISGERNCRGQTVVAATHAGFIVASFLTRFAIPRPGTGTRIDPDFARLTEWRVQQGSWRLVRYNDTAHERIYQ